MTLFLPTGARAKEMQMCEETPDRRILRRLPEPEPSRGFLTNALKTTVRRREFIATAGGATLTALLAGCGGGGGGGGSTVNAFSVTPTRGAPGSIVTLTGVNVTPESGASVLMGGQPAVIHAWLPAGLQVFVPAKVNPTTFAPVTPTAPMPVTVQIGTGTIVTSSNMYTVTDLPPAPGTTAALATEMHAMSAFFQDFLQNGFIPAFGANPGLNTPGLVQGAAFAGAVQDLIDGPDNPNSLQKILAGTAPLLNGAKIPLDLMDSLLAQGPAQALFSDFAQTVVGAIRDIAPDAVVTRRVDRSSRDWIPTSFSAFKVIWNGVNKAKMVVITIQLQKFLAKYANSNDSTLAQLAYGAGMQMATAIALAVAPELVAALALTDFAINVGMKLLAVMSTVLPAVITDLYVEVNGVERRVGDKSVDIKLGLETPLRFYLVMQSAGGVAITAAGLAQIFLQVAAQKVPGLKTYLSSVNAAAVYNTVFVRMLGYMDNIWQLISGSGPPSEWALTKATSTPSFKYPKVDVNSSNVVGIVSRSINLLSVGSNGDGEVFLKGIHAGEEAGYQATLRPENLSPKLPSLADVAGSKVFVPGVVNIPGGTIKVGIT
jgi:hypothetical protein